MRSKPVDEGWLKAYGWALFVVAYQGHCTFEHDGIVVTIRTPDEEPILSSDMTPRLVPLRK